MRNDDRIEPQSRVPLLPFSQLFVVSGFATDPTLVSGLRF